MASDLEEFLADQQAEILMLRGEVKRLRNGWTRITDAPETWPKLWADVLLYYNNPVNIGVVIGRRVSNDFESMRAYSHWRPLPPGPVEGERVGTEGRE